MSRQPTEDDGVAMVAIAEEFVGRARLAASNMGFSGTMAEAVALTILQHGYGMAVAESVPTDAPRQIVHSAARVAEMQIGSAVRHYAAERAGGRRA